MKAATTVYKPVHVIIRNSKIYDKVTATIRCSYGSGEKHCIGNGRNSEEEFKQIK